MLRFSVIIPAYNCEDYIERTIKSVLNQKFYNYELIVVNDGSTDKTHEKLKSFAQKYNNIKIYNKINGGVSDARNFGLAKSIGEYIIFIDSDDYILEGYFEYINNIITEDPVDCIIFNHLIGNTKKITSKIEKLQIKREELLNQHEIIERFLMGKITNSPWDKVFKKTTIKNVVFPKGVIVGEDALFVINFFLNSTKIKTSKKFYYVYLQDTNGVTKSTFSDKKIKDITFIMKKIREKLQGKADEQKISFMIFNQMLAYIVNSNLKMLLDSNESKFFYENLNQLKLKEIKGFKKKVAFTLLSFFYKYIRKCK